MFVPGVFNVYCHLREKDIANRFQRHFKDPPVGITITLQTMYDLFVVVRN